MHEGVAWICHVERRNAKISAAQERDAHATQVRSAVLCFPLCGIKLSMSSSDYMYLEKFEGL